jgi:hypothetical protein
MSGGTRALSDAPRGELATKSEQLALLEVHYQLLEDISLICDSDL